VSFSSDLKHKILEQPYKSACCRRAFVNGIIFSKGKILNDEINISLESSECIEYTSVLIKEFFGISVSYATDLHGGRRKVISFRSPACQRYLDSLLDYASPLFKERCSLCSSAFLRGVFLASGRVSDPKKQYRIEFSPSSNVDRLLNYLTDLGLSFSKTVRRTENILYTGNSSVSEDFFAAIGMNSAAFFLMNSKIESEFKNNANRIRNCETNNIMKTVSASARWVEAIEALEEANLLSTLPDELEKTARLRMEYKDYSLARLAAEFTPPISKPGLSHRLNKIVEISEVLLGKK